MSNIAENLNKRIEELISTGALSKTGVGRFNSLIADFSEHLHIPLDEIYIVSCARPNNLNIRLTQGSAQHRHRSLGLGVIPEPEDISKAITAALKAGSKFIGDGNAQYDAVGIVINQNNRWVVGGIIEAEGSNIGANLKTAFPNIILEYVINASPATTSSNEHLEETKQDTQASGLNELVLNFSNDLKKTNLIFSDEMLVRFCASLLARKFLVLTGLSGSGKTKLAEAFSKWLTRKPTDLTPSFYKIISVGADWTSSEQVLGYPDALNPRRYETRPALDLLLRSITEENKSSPHILILDEMNLSHVERYFSEFLSGMETDSPIDLYAGVARDGIPSKIPLASNLFICGTVNVDETTYLFSPKVLDRANVIEFRAEEDEIFSFLESFGAVDLSVIEGNGAHFGRAFIHAANIDPQLSEPDKSAVAEAFRRVFKIMSFFGREFGFRTLRDVARYVYFHKLLVGSADWNIDEAIDAQIYQRVLPRIHGSRSQVQLLIWMLGHFCLVDDLSDIKFEKEIMQVLRQEQAMKDPFDLPENLEIIAGSFVGAKYPLTAAKLYRMNRKLRDGFVSFMEA